MPSLSIVVPFVKLDSRPVQSCACLRAPEPLQRVAWAPGPCACGPLTIVLWRAAWDVAEWRCGRRDAYELASIICRIRELYRRPSMPRARSRSAAVCPAYVRSSTRPREDFGHPSWFFLGTKSESDYYILAPFHIAQLRPFAPRRMPATVADQAWPWSARQTLLRWNRA